MSSIDVEIYFVHGIYYSGLWKAFTTSWFKIYSIVILLYGLNVIIFSIKSLKLAGISFNIEADWLWMWSFIYFSIDFDTYDSIDLMSYYVGYPVNWQIFYNWSKVELPANNGFCASIS